MNSLVAPLSTKELMDFTSPVSVVSSSTFSLREVERSSAEAMTSLDGSRRPHFGCLFRTISVGVTIGFSDMGFCTSIDGSTVSLREHVGKTEKQLWYDNKACCSLVAMGKILLLNLRCGLQVFHIEFRKAIL